MGKTLFSGKHQEIEKLSGVKGAWSDHYIFLIFVLIVPFGNFELFVFTTIWLFREMREFHVSLTLLGQRGLGWGNVSQGELFRVT